MTVEGRAIPIAGAPSASARRKVVIAKPGRWLVAALAALCLLGCAIFLVARERRRR